MIIIRKIYCIRKWNKLQSSSLKINEENYLNLTAFGSQYKNSTCLWKSTSARFYGKYELMGEDYYASRNIFQSKYYDN